MFKHNTPRLVRLASCGIATLAITLTLGLSSAAALQKINTVTPSEKVGDDFDMPIRVRSDEQFVDAKMKTSVFEKNVVIKQGSLVIDAQYVKVDAINGKGKEVFTIKGNPANYTQTLADGSNVEARAQTILYDIGTRTISLEGQAELVQNASTVKGDKIVFDMEKEQMRAQGNTDADGQVETIFSPDSKKSEPKQPPAQQGGQP